MSVSPQSLVLRTLPPVRTENNLRACVRSALEDYFATLDGHQASGLYDMVLREIEQPLLETVLRHAQGNQTRAAEMLGLNRATLRKKLKQYGID